MIPLTLVVGGSASDRDSAIARALADAPAEESASAPVALILEGVPGGSSPLAAPAAFPFPLHVARIAPGCPCCAGNLPLKVTLNRMLRQQPRCLFLGVAATAHLERLRDFLRAPPYTALLQLTQDLVVGSRK